MPHSHSEIYAKIDRAASISDRVSAAMLRHNMAALAERGTFHARMAMVKQHHLYKILAQGLQLHMTLGLL